MLGGSIYMRAKINKKPLPDDLPTYTSTMGGIRIDRNIIHTHKESKTVHVNIKKVFANILNEVETAEEKTITYGTKNISIVIVTKYDLPIELLIDSVIAQLQSKKNAKIFIPYNQQSSATYSIHGRFGCAFSYDIIISKELFKSETMIIRIQEHTKLKSENTKLRNKLIELGDENVELKKEREDLMTQITPLKKRIQEDSDFVTELMEHQNTIRTLTDKNIKLISKQEHLLAQNTALTEQFVSMGKKIKIIAVECKHIPDSGEIV